MTVEGRGGRAAEGYAIMPMDRLAELLELAAGRRFVPLHERIAERTSDEPMPALRGASKLRQQGRAGRPMRRNVPAPEFPSGTEGLQGKSDAGVPASGSTLRSEDRPD